MTEISKICAVTGASFVVDDLDQAFYEKIGVPSPTLCPDERTRRRLAWRGKNFYMRKMRCHESFCRQIRSDWCDYNRIQMPV